jgi:hypothetical protein
MKLFIIILLIHFVKSFGDDFTNFDKRFTKNQLRGMHKQYLEGLIKESFVKTFDSLYDKIIECAKLGINEYHFTIMCKELPNNNCEIHNGHQVWAQDYPYNIVVTSKPYITIEQYTTNVINALKQTFLDSNITKINKNCCDYYTIKW